MPLCPLLPLQREQAALEPRKCWNWSCWWLSRARPGHLWGKEVALEVTTGLLRTVRVADGVGGAVSGGLPAAASPRLPALPAGVPGSAQGVGTFDWL